MKCLNRYPLYSTADSLQRALAINGFRLYDHGISAELVTAEQTQVSAMNLPGSVKPQNIFLEDGSFALRSELLVTHLASMKSSLPIRAAAVGRVYDRKGGDYPAHLSLEGVYADKGITFKDYQCLWGKIAEELYGIASYAKFIPVNNELYKIVICENGEEFSLGYTGPASWFAKTLLGTECPQITTWIFCIDIDNIAIRDFALESRPALYSVLQKDLKKNCTSSPAYGDTFANRVSNLLRKRGYLEFCGQKLYEENAYVKMNMIQESWDKNNQGIKLTEPLGDKTGLPTVLTPSLEEALSANYKNGEESVKIFEIGHIFRPKSGENPREKIAVSIGAYGPDLTKGTFRKEIDDFLTELGIKNHFFFPTDMAIAYDLTDCWLVLDEKLNYLECNFGGISPIAEKNHGIGTHSFMAQFELEPLEKKAQEEYVFVPTELM